MTMAQAIAQAKTWTFSGLKSNKGFDYVGVIPETELPALVLQFPLYPKFDAFEPLTITGSSGAGVWYVEHCLLCFSAALKRPPQRLDAIITLADLYLDKLVADATLGGYLTQPMDVMVMPPGVVEFNNSLYAGVVFMERWSVLYS